MIIRDNIEIKMDDKRFSIISAFHNDENHLEVMIDSLINQNIDFKDNVQLILIDCGSEDESYDIALEYEKNYPENILLLSQESSSIASGRNLGFKYATGEYINFLDCRDYLDLNALNEIESAFNKYGEDIICLPVCSFSNASKTPQFYRNTGVINVDEMPELNLKFIYSAFFKRHLIEDIKFEPGLADGDELLFASMALSKIRKYVLLNGDKYYFLRKRNAVSEDLKHKKEFFISKMKYLLVGLLDYSVEKYGKTDRLAKYVVLQNLILLIKDENISGIMDDKDLENFFGSIKYILSLCTSDEIRELLDDYSDSAFLIAIKNGDIALENIAKNKPSDSFKLKITDNDVQLFSNDCLIESLSERSICLDFATLRDDVLYFSGFLKTILNRNHISVSAIKQYSNGNVEIIDATSYPYPTRSSSSMMNFEWEHFYNFDLEVPIKSEKEISSVKLMVYYNEGDRKSEIDCAVDFRKYCNISHASHYYVKDNRIIMFDGKFNIMPYSYLKMVKYEIRGILKLISIRDLFFKQAVFFRILHLILYPYMKNKEIWMIMDKQDSGDDNAEHFYKYALKQDDGIKKFFTVLQNVPDFKRLNDAYGNVLAYESIKHRFYYMFTDKLISSQGSEFYMNPFRNKGYYQTAGISNVDFYFLQHGIIKDNMSSWLRKYDRNPKLIVTSTQLEYESLFDEGYNYTDKVIQLLGLPRYDNLNNRGLKKQIVIMPSWRNYLKDENDVLNSGLFKRFNSLINNRRLIGHAKQKGYEIVFKPHPEFARYLYLFDKNDYVQFDLDKKYQVVFNESSLLITDYSSIFFDFSYLKKPLIYYQYASDYHYDSDNGYFQYETMGFGPVIRDEEELVDRLIEYMDNDCVMEDIYKKRVDDFFKYHDHDNSKRCYDWIRNH